MLDQEAEKTIGAEIKCERKTKQEQSLTILRGKMNKSQIRGNDVAQMKGASAWLTSLPIKDKREFFDSVAMRYRWDLKRLPNNCVCGQRFTMDHALQCGNGGYIIRRHNRIRDLLAHLLNEVANGVHIEPRLEPVTREPLPSGANTKDEARPDIAARGFWQECAMAFFDVKVFNPFAKTHIHQSIGQLQGVLIC